MDQRWVKNCQVKGPENLQSSQILIPSYNRFLGWRMTESAPCVVHPIGQHFLRTVWESLTMPMILPGENGKIGSQKNLERYGPPHLCLAPLCCGLFVPVGWQRVGSKMFQTKIIFFFKLIPNSAAICWEVSRDLCRTATSEKFGKNMQIQNHVHMVFIPGY